MPEGLNVEKKDIQEKPNLESSKVIEVDKNANEVSKEKKEEIVNQRKEKDQTELKERLAEINKFFDEKNNKFGGESYIPNAETNRLSDEKKEIEANLIIKQEAVLDSKSDIETKRQALEGVKINDPAVQEKLSKILGTDIGAEEIEKYKKYINEEISDDKAKQSSYFARIGLPDGNDLFINGDGTFNIRG